MEVFPEGIHGKRPRAGKDRGQTISRRGILKAAVGAVGLAAVGGGVYAATQSGDKEAQTGVRTDQVIPDQTIEHTDNPRTDTPKPTEFEFIFDENFSVSDNKLIEESIITARDYYYDKLGVYVKLRKDEPLVVFPKKWAFQEVANAGSNSIAINTGVNGWIEASQERKRRIVFHEYFHFIQRTFKNESPRRAEIEPPWFFEGAAEYAAARALGDLKVVNFESVRAEELERLRRNGRTLPPIEYATTSDTGAFYSLGFTAVDRLVGEKESAAIGELYRGLAQGLTFDDAFKNTFGKDLKNYEAEFEAFRSTLY